MSGLRVTFVSSISFSRIGYFAAPPAPDFVEAQDVEVNDRLAAEIFQIVAEGLSNIRRHTQSVSAAVRLSREEKAVVIRIENHNLCYHINPPLKKAFPDCLHPRGA